MRLEEVCTFLNEYLKIDEFRDVSNNGLQVEGGKNVEKIAFAVDACLESFRAAKKCGADMLVVHHGLIWGGIDYVTGIVRKRLEYLIKSDLSLYAAHLPLDAHPEVGNNALILKTCGGFPETPFGEYRGVKIGYSCSISATLEDLLGKFRRYRVLLFGDDDVGKIAAVSGRGGFAIGEAVENGVDVFITGEAEHEIYHLAKEGGVSVIFLGHYESEKFGVMSLKRVVEDELELETEFIDVPTDM